MTTAAITNYLIESTKKGVNLCESQGDQWIVIQRNVTKETASQYGFNLDSPAVQAVFDAAKEQG